MGINPINPIIEVKDGKVDIHFPEPPKQAANPTPDPLKEALKLVKDSTNPQNINELPTNYDPNTNKHVIDLSNPPKEVKQDLNQPIAPKPTKLKKEPIKRIYDKKVHGKRYTFAQKLAVRSLLQAGMSPSEIQKEEGMDASTVYNVMKDKRVEILAQKQVEEIKRSLVGMTYGNSFRAQQAITDEKLSNSSALQLMTISAIGIDKGRLMEGLSTENVSFRGVAASVEDDRQKLMKRIEALDSDAA